MLDSPSSVSTTIPWARHAGCPIYGCLVPQLDGPILSDAWTRSATRTPRAPASGRPSSPAASAAGAFDVVLERIARGRPERSLVLTGLRGVGKTVLLNALAPRRQTALGHRQDRGPAGPVAAPPDRRRAAHGCPGAGPAPRADRIDAFLGVLRAFAQRTRPAAAAAPKLRDRWQPGIDVPAATGRATPATSRSTWSSCSPTPPAVAADVGTGIAIFIDEMQDLGPEDVSALCAACHEMCQSARR